MRDPFEPFLAVREVFVLDGALATELERRGADLRDPLWSAKYLIEQPELIRAVHRAYYEAGADVATTATYQATFAAFQRRGLQRNAGAQLMRDAVALAVAARDDFWGAHTRRADAAARPRLRPLVAASIGPYGAMLADGSEYRGHYGVSDEELRDFHRPRLEILAATDADLLACETLPCLREALVVARLLAEFPTTPAWISFSCRDGTRTCEGDDVAQCAAALDGFENVVAMGVNCTHPDHVGSLLRCMRSTTAKHLLAYPNSGEHYHAVGKTWSGGGSALPHAVRAQEWFGAGARLIGGCCRTTPHDIGAIRGACFNAP